jgi:hypothetical protein
MTMVAAYFARGARYDDEAYEGLRAFEATYTLTTSQRALALQRQDQAIMSCLQVAGIYTGLGERAQAEKWVGTARSRFLVLWPGAVQAFERAFSEAISHTAARHSYEPGGAPA